MLKIKSYLFKTTFKYILTNQIVILFVVLFLNIIELSRYIKNEDKSILNFFILSSLKIPSIINETSPFVIIISTAFLFRYLITNNELISMRNIGFSIFDIFKPIAICILIYGSLILIILNPLTAISEIKYDTILNKTNNKMYSINLSNNNLWIKNKNFDEGIYYINIDKFNAKEMIAKNIRILSINNDNNTFIFSKNGYISKKNFILNDVDYFNIDNDSYEFKKNLQLKLNFSKENIMSSVVNFRNIPYYNYINHTNTLKKFNLYTSAIGLHYLSEFLKPLFMILLSFVVMGYSAKYKRNESFFKVLFYAVLFGFIFYILREIVNKFTITYDINYIYSYLMIFILPLLLGIYKVLQIEND